MIFYYHYIVEIDLIHKGIKTLICENVYCHSLVIVEIDLIHKGIKTEGQADIVPDAKVEIDLIHKGIKTQQISLMRQPKRAVEIDLIHKGIKT